MIIYITTVTMKYMVSYHIIKQKNFSLIHFDFGNTIYIYIIITLAYILNVISWKVSTVEDGDRLISFV